MKTALIGLLLAAAAAGPAAAQTPAFDSSGNGLLSGTYYFRELAYQITDNAADPSDAVALYGTISFDGNGNFTGSATYLDAARGGSAGTITGTYSISSSGYGFLSHPLFNGVRIYGLVSNGIFVASSTEGGFNDLFIAAQLSSPQPTLANFKGTYTVAAMDFGLTLQQGSVYTIGSTFQLNPDGAGNLGTVSVSGYLGGGGTQTYSQSAAGLKYISSNGAYSVTFPTNSSATLVAGQKIFYISPDGNFIFGGGSANGNPFDFFVGVRNASGSNLSGMYYQAGVDEDFSQLGSTGYAYLESYFGSFTANSNSGAIVGHQRRQDSLYSNAFDNSYGDAFTVKSDGTYSTPGFKYVVGGGGVRIGSGIGPLLGITVAVPAPVLSGTGVFLNPQGVVNAASLAPFTQSVAPGEVLVISGTGLSNDANLEIAPAGQLPTTLAGVQVMINGVAAPIMWVSPTAVSAIVPYSTTTAVAQIQVFNNGAPSNIVTNFTGKSAAGVFTQTSDGLGLAIAVHSDGTSVTEAHPAQIGETISVFLTGLGAVMPAVSDGSVAPTNPYSLTLNTIAADVSGVTATVGYAGLAPGMAGLYQVNLTIPTGLTAGDNTVDISGPDSYTAEAILPVVAASSAEATSMVASPRTRQAAASNRIAVTPERRIAVKPGRRSAFEHRSDTRIQ